MLPYDIEGVPGSSYLLALQEGGYSEIRKHRQELAVPWEHLCNKEPKCPSAASQPLY